MGPAQANGSHSAASSRPGGPVTPEVNGLGSATTRLPTTAPRPPVTTTPAPAAPEPAPTSAPSAAGGSQQEIVVDAASYSSTTATLIAYEETNGQWSVALGPWQANLGYGGIAPTGAKREGDGRTPSGRYGFSFFFGVQPNPGVSFPYRQVTGPNIVWDDDPSSPLYNQWVDDSVSNPGANPEPMENTPAYDYGAAIAYNTNPVIPGDGSAIFLHVSTGGSTAGCVSIPEAELLDILHWMHPAEDPVIVMGVGVSR